MSEAGKNSHAEMYIPLDPHADYQKRESQKTPKKQRGRSREEDDPTECRHKAGDVHAENPRSETAEQKPPRDP